jgi:hypothetical protein
MWSMVLPSQAQTLVWSPGGHQSPLECYKALKAPVTHPKAVGQTNSYIQILSTGLGLEAYRPG